MDLNLNFESAIKCHCTHIGHENTNASQITIHLSKCTTNNNSFIKKHNHIFSVSLIFLNTDMALQCVDFIGLFD